jgi:ABC-2 type transport system ATP-binding protein
MSVIQVQNLAKQFKVHEKEPGLRGSVKSLLNRKYRTVNAVNNISFDIKQGELVGFIGPNGAGKTTTLKVLSGLLYPTSGDISVLGFTPHERKPDFQKQFALVMGQKNQLWWDLPAQETFNLNKEIYEVPDRDYKKTLNKLIDLLQVKDIVGIQVRKLSLGQRMKCELIAALIHNPKVLFLDEPTIGLDVVMQKVMRDFIKEYNQEFNSTIILTSHYMDDVKALCERIIIIDQGQVHYDGKLQNVIDKYARNKILTVVFEDTVSQSDLGIFGSISKYDPPRVQLLVPRKEAASKAAALFTQFKIEDINIEEPPIEAIIRDAFSQEA